MLNAQAVRHVSMRNVAILVPARVVLALFVMLSIILRAVFAPRDILEILSLTVYQSHHQNVRAWCKIITKFTLLISTLIHKLAVVKDDPCNPSPCGSNSQCNNGICTCLPEYQGDPYTGCRPECVLNTDCQRDRACIRNKCVDPCPGTCASNALCSVINHIPICSCPKGMSGNAFIQCSPLPRKYQ